MKIWSLFDQMWTLKKLTTNQRGSHGWQCSSGDSKIWIKGPWIRSYAFFTKASLRTGYLPTGLYSWQKVHVGVPCLITEEFSIVLLLQLQQNMKSLSLGAGWVKESFRPLGLTSTDCHSYCCSRPPSLLSWHLSWSHRGDLSFLPLSGFFIHFSFPQLKLQLVLLYTSTGTPFSFSLSCCPGAPFSYGLLLSYFALLLI